jgi:hypothetical protein
MNALPRLPRLKKVDICAVFTVSGVPVQPLDGYIEYQP